jgi:hypothetical protein
MAPLTPALASGSIAISQVPVTVTVTASATRVDVPADILFDYDKADILPNAAELLGSSRNPA